MSDVSDNIQEWEAKPSAPETENGVKQNLFCVQKQQS